MGTRGSYGFIINDKVYSKYNHFDSYPSGLGSDVVDFVEKINELNEVDTLKNYWDQLKEKVLQLKDIDENVEPTPEDIERYRKYTNLGVATQSEKDWYCLLRDAQDAEVYLNAILDGDIIHFPNNPTWLKDSLFCEYAYLINLDDMTLDCYEGFQKEFQVGNRFGVESNDSGYFPCKLVVKLPLNDVTFDQVESAYNPVEDENEE